MAKVITFSTKFPGNHPRKGQDTEFIGKILMGLIESDYKPDGFDNIHTALMALGVPIVIVHDDPDVKHHTFRAGFRWKVGDKFSPRFWTGLPYRSPQRQFAPNLEIKKIWTLEYEGTPGDWRLDGKVLTIADVTRIAANDGLELLDFIDWFPSPIKGQLICWNENINY